MGVEGDDIESIRLALKPGVDSKVMSRKNKGGNGCGSKELPREAHLHALRLGHLL